MANIGRIESNISLGLGLLASFGQNVDVVGIYSNAAGQGGASGAVGVLGLSSTIINSILGIPNATASIGQQFENARPMKATIRETSKVMEHPVESGSTIADHHIINPVEIDIPLIVNSEFYAATYSQIRQNWINATPLAVKTRVGVYSNMIIADMPHEEDAEMFDVITINLRLKQVIFVLPGGDLATNYQPFKADNSNTIQSGLQQALGLSAQAVNAAGSVSSYAALLKL